MLLCKVEDLASLPYMVRRYSAGQVEELAALIASPGLLQNPIVTEQVGGRGKRRQTKFGVVAGERRRRALVLLQERQVLATGREVLCELVNAGHAVEISLAENIWREVTHPADEFEAFHAMVEQGQVVKDEVPLLDVSLLVVQRRFNLAALLPKLLALYREDGDNLDQLIALCLSSDHAAQERAWLEVQSWECTPAALRKRLTEGEVLSHQSALAGFDGIEAYEEAGGAVRRDSFDSDQACWMCDPDLLRRLAAKKLDTEAHAVCSEAGPGSRRASRSPTRLPFRFSSDSAWRPAPHCTSRLGRHAMSCCAPRTTCRPVVLGPSWRVAAPDGSLDFRRRKASGWTGSRRCRSRNCSICLACVRRARRWCRPDWRARPADWSVSPGSACGSGGSRRRRPS
jgi:ParB family chromosome partitioning protein